jgi:hypothetical protein
MKIIRAYSDETTNGKVFGAFLAIIIVSYMIEKLKELNESGGHKRMGKEKLLSELEKSRRSPKGTEDA